MASAIRCSFFNSVLRLRLGAEIDDAIQFIWREVFARSITSGIVRAE